MTVKYNDPYGKREYARLKGDKKDTFFKISFDEATLHKTDDSYILYGYITEYQGIVRSFKPQDPILPGICAVPFYGREYELRFKGTDGNYNTEKIQPSIFEAELHRYLGNNEDKFFQYKSVFKGSITHIPNMMLASYQGQSLTDFVVNNIQLEQTELTDKLPPFSPPTSFKKGGSSWKSFGATMEEKVAFLVKQMELDVKDERYKQGRSLADLTDQLIKEHSDNENFIQIYFDMLIACVR